MARKTNAHINGRDYYRVRRTIGRDENGKPVVKSFYGSGKAEAEAKANEYMNREESGAETKKSIAELMKFYALEVLPSEGLAEGSIKNYQRGYRKLKKCEALFCVLSDFNSEKVQLHLNSMPSDSAKLEAFKFFRRFSKYMQKNGLKHDISAGLSVKPARKAQEIETFTQEEIKKILRQDSSVHFVALLAVSTGLRISELLALEVSDIAGGVVSVNKQLSIDAKGTAPTKSLSSVRSVPIPENVQRELNDYVADNELTGLLFPSLTGGYRDRRNVLRAWRRLLNNAGVNYRKFHALRATYCTMLCSSGVSIETASRLMGHSSLAVTAKFYRSVSADEMEKASQAIGDNLANY